MQSFKQFHVILVASFAFVAVGFSSANAAGTLKVQPAKVVNFKVNLKKNSAASRYLNVYNTGNGNLDVTFGNATAPFDVACSCTKVTIAPHSGVRAVMAFKPTAAGTFTETFHIDSDASKGNAHVVVTLRGVATGTPRSSSASVSGSVTAGQTPVANAKVNLFAAGDNSGSSDTTLIGTTTANSEGQFQLSRVYCANPNAQVYAVSTGGVPGGCSTENSALSFMAALGTCADLSNSSSVTINEVTTAAAAVALSPFITNSNPPEVAAPAASANALSNAFAEAQRLVNQESGQLVASGSAVQGEVASMSNALASCAQCGGASASACQEVLACSAPGAIAGSGTCSGGSASITDTLQAAFSLAGTPPSANN